MSSLDYRTYPAHSRIAPHRHARPSLTIVLGGDYEESIGGRAGMQQAGSALICPEELSHEQHFGVRGARKVIVHPAGGLLDYLNSTMALRTAPAARSAAIRALAARIDAERRTDDGFSRGAIEGLVWQVSAEMGRGLAGACVPTSTIVRRACALIDGAEGETLSIAQLCHDLDCHPATLTRAFRREQGCTPADYQRRMRVEKAARLLRTTRMPIAEIAANCGFCDQAHLARSFRAALACAPSEYRRRA